MALVLVWVLGLVLVSGRMSLVFSLVLLLVLSLVLSLHLRPCLLLLLPSHPPFCFSYPTLCGLMVKLSARVFSHRILIQLCGLAEALAREAW